MEKNDLGEKEKREKEKKRERKREKQRKTKKNKEKEGERGRGNGGGDLVLYQNQSHEACPYLCWSSPPHQRLDQRKKNNPQNVLG